MFRYWEGERRNKLVQYLYELWKVLFSVIWECTCMQKCEESQLSQLVKCTRVNGVFVGLITTSGAMYSMPWSWCWSRGLMSSSVWRIFCIHIPEFYIFLSCLVKPLPLPKIPLTLSHNCILCFILFIIFKKQRAKNIFIS